MVFYSEGRDYWSYLNGLIKCLIDDYNVHICYLSSSFDDPGIIYDKKNFNAYVIGDGHIRNWVFENLVADVMVMTTPDLHQYQLKRSVNKVHYIYVQHSLVSLHTIYRDGAFDYFDTIFCGGPHHNKEVREIEKSKNLPKKKLFNHGYSLLDIVKQESKHKNFEKDRHKINILIAPSWGPDGLIETAGLKLINLLLACNFDVTLRPHPQTKKLYPSKIQKILEKFSDNDCFSMDKGLDKRDSLYKADLMITDWSGVALDYAFGLNRPVLFIDLPRKINNPSHDKISLDPFEVWIREIVGIVIPMNEVSKIDKHIKLAMSKKLPKDSFNNYVYNISNSSSIGAKYIYDLVS